MEEKFLKSFDQLEKIRTRYSIETLMGDDVYKSVYLSKIRAVCNAASSYAKEFVFKDFHHVPAEKADALIEKTKNLLDTYNFSKSAYKMLITDLDKQSFLDMLANIKTSMYQIYLEV